ncbi:MAG: response regulator [Desulfobacterales bacterium]|nr:response regulator [Desulfobacterales bacterium]
MTTPTLYFKLLIAALPFPVYMTDSQGIILIVNQVFCDLLGQLKEEDLVGKHVSQLPPHFSILHEQKQPSSSKVQLTIDTSKNSKKYFEMHQHILAESNGTQLGIMHCLVDVTEKKTLSDEVEILKKQVEMDLQKIYELNDAADTLREHIQQAEESADSGIRVKREFIANISHELRTPLTGIIGHLDLIKQGSELNQSGTIDTIRTNAEHLLVMINSMIEYSKFESNAIQIYPVEFELKELLIEIIKPYKFKAKQKGLFIQSEFFDNLPLFVIGDPKRIDETLSYVLDNAVKFSTKGMIVFQALWVDGCLQCNIIDQGIGIPKEEIELIFEPFHQFVYQYQKPDGAGLGLSKCKALVQLMGGKIEVESTLGKGAHFSVNIPLVPIKQHKDTYKNILGFQGEKIKILIVDDINMNRLFLSEQLKQLGFEVFEAENGERGIEQAFQHEPDVIFMDLMMPVLDGFRATERIRQNTALSKTIIIALSAAETENTYTMCKMAGCDGFIVRPFHIDKILRAIKKNVHVKWIYQSDIKPESDEYTHIIKPPEHELRKLYQLTLEGDIFSIQKHANKLHTLGNEYTPFARMLSDLAKQLKINQIKEFLEKYIDPNEC